MGKSGAKGAETKLAEQSARTRQLLLDATLKLLAERSFHKLSLDAIAAKAGVTKGAIYGHFESKDALLIAALATQGAARPDTLVWPKRTGSAKQRLRRLGEAVFDQQRDAGPAAERAAKYILYALSQDELRSQTAALFANTRESVETQVRALFDPEELAMPVSSVALLLGGMIIPSLVFTRALAGAQIKREEVLAIFEGLAASRR